MTIGEGFGPRMREAIREMLGEDKEREFARRIGMDPTQLSRALNSKVGKVPEPETLVRYAKGLQKPLIELLSWIYPIEEELAREPRPDDPLWLMSERVRRDHDLMRQLSALEQASDPDVFDVTVEAVGEAWRANLRMGITVAEAKPRVGGN